MYDILIRHGRIIDGTGNPWYHGDIAIAGGKIAAVGNLFGLVAKEEYDAGGKCVCPGFIDIHTHSDKTRGQYPLAESRILQGVTTEIGGNCGISPFPVTAKYREELRSYEGGELTYQWQDVGGFLDFLQAQGGSTNFGCLAGHGSLRLAVMGFSAEQASPEQLDQMRRLAVDSLRGGAFGISSGLIYPPGSYSNRQEMVSVLAALRECGGYYATHMRNERQDLIVSVEEALAVAEAAQVPMEISHHKCVHKPQWGVAVRRTTEMIGKARERGLDVCCDQYPYRASATVLSSNIPGWGFEGGIDQLIERLHDPRTRARLRDEADESHRGRWQDIYVSYLESEANRWMIGKSVTEIGEQVGKCPADLVFDLVEEEYNKVNEINFGMCEEDIEWIMIQPYVMPASDGEAYSLDALGQPHPRNFGTFPRVLAHYCRGRRLFSLEEAIRRMTSLPANRVGLADRGLIRRGMWADLVIFDFSQLESCPTYERPKQACGGISQVFVNGVLTAEHGRHTGRKAGQILRAR